METLPVPASPVAPTAGPAAPASRDAPCTLPPQAVVATSKRLKNALRMGLFLPRFARVGRHPRVSANLRSSARVRDSSSRYCFPRMIVR